MSRPSSPVEILPPSLSREIFLNTLELLNFADEMMPEAPSTKDLDLSRPNPIKILVGPEEDRFLAPRSLLEKVPFFRACLDADMQESESGVIKLPDDDYQAFVEVMDWMYHHRLGDPLSMRVVNGAPPKSNDFSNFYVLRHPDIALAAKTYNLGRKLGMEELPNKIMDELRHYKAQHPRTTDAEFDYIFNSPVVEEKLRDYFLSPVIASIRKSGWTAWLGSNRNRAVYEEYLYEQATNMELLLKAAFSGEDKIAQDYRACDWHIHIESDRCDRPPTRVSSLLRKRSRISSPTSTRKERGSLFDVLAEDSDGG